jgi:hypothetical protein
MLGLPLQRVIFLYDLTHKVTYNKDMRIPGGGIRTKEVATMRQFLHTMQLQVLVEVEDRPEDVLTDVYQEMAQTLQTAVDGVQCANCKLSLTDLDLQTIEELPQEATR